jgi:hypothetical protein
MASKKAVVAARVAIIGVYKAAAEEALPKDQLGLLHTCLKPYSDKEVGDGVELFIFGQDTVWKDGQSVYSVLRKFCNEARSELLKEQSMAISAARSKAWTAWLDDHSPTDAAIGRHSVSLLAKQMTEEAQVYSRLEREEQIELLPKGAIEKAAEHLAKLRIDGPPSYFQIPEVTDE